MVIRSLLDLLVITGHLLNVRTLRTTSLKSWREPVSIPKLLDYSTVQRLIGVRDPNAFYRSPIGLTLTRSMGRVVVAAAHPATLPSHFHHHALVRRTKMIGLISLRIWMMECAVRMRALPVLVKMSALENIRLAEVSGLEIPIRPDHTVVFQLESLLGMHLLRRNTGEAWKMVQGMISSTRSSSSGTRAARGSNATRVL